MTDRQRLQIIRQAEVSNLSDEDMQKLLKWAAMVELSQSMLDSICKGYLRVIGMDGMIPDVIITSEGSEFLTSKS